MSENLSTLLVLPAITADGADDAVEIPAYRSLSIRPVGADAELRHELNGANSGPLTRDLWTTLPPSVGQTVYLRAAAGTVIKLWLL